MKIDNLSTTLGVENCQDVTHKMASSTICTRQLFISGFSYISPSNGKFGWNILGELVKPVEGLVNKLEISTRYVNCSVKSASNRFDRFLCPPFPYFNA